MTVTGSVNPHKAGDYYVTYTYVDSAGNAHSVTVKVTVVKSDASLSGHDTTINEGSDWNPSDSFGGGTDGYGRPITINNVVVTGTVDTNKPGDYLITYTYTDEGGNVFTVTVIVHVTGHSNVPGQSGSGNQTSSGNHQGSDNSGQDTESIGQQTNSSESNGTSDHIVSLGHHDAQAKGKSELPQTGDDKIQGPLLMGIGFTLFAFLGISRLFNQRRD
ncbi:hypothetical protein DCM90_02950 [Levilactobacillus bambusae]|uniref:Pesticidal crystal protein Cry22Aa Ig-like domain-containing protein n=1 Tax=Levilactobacillus bambusae TaxID=2024736 RepID=A0A2V1N013_9LACO|nr:hypothetical protein DCM90_02950 [Levilactobacillus bambusae]